MFIMAAREPLLVRRRCFVLFANLWNGAVGACCALPPLTIMLARGCGGGGIICPAKTTLTSRLEPKGPQPSRLRSPLTSPFPRPQRRPARGYSPSLLSPSIIDGAEEDREKYSFHSFLLCRRRRAESAKIVRRARPSGGGGTREGNGTRLLHQPAGVQS